MDMMLLGQGRSAEACARGTAVPVWSFANMEHPGDADNPKRLLSYSRPYAYGRSA